MALEVSNLISRHMKRKPDNRAAELGAEVAANAVHFLTHTQAGIDGATAQSKREFGDPERAADLRKRAEDHRDTARLLDAEADRVALGRRGNMVGMI